MIPCVFRSIQPLTGGGFFYFQGRDSSIHKTWQLLFEIHCTYYDHDGMISEIEGHERGEYAKKMEG